MRCLQIGATLGAKTSLSSRTERYSLLLPRVKINSRGGEMARSSSAHLRKQSANRPASNNDTANQNSGDNMPYTRTMSLVSTAFLAGFALLASLIFGQDAPSTKPSSKAPLIKLLPRFESASVPVMSPEEVEPPNFHPGARQPEGLPGNGLAQHPMLYIGEGYNKMFVVNHGKIVWATIRPAPAGSTTTSGCSRMGTFFSRECSTSPLSHRRRRWSGATTRPRVPKFTPVSRSA